jgi:hypothetical protein
MIIKKPTLLGRLSLPFIISKNKVYYGFLNEKKLFLM